MTTPLDKGARRAAEVKDRLREVFRRVDGALVTTPELEIAFDAIWKEATAKFPSLSNAKEEFRSHVLWHFSRLAEDNMTPTRTEVRDELMEISTVADRLLTLLDKLSHRAENAMISAISDHELPPLPTEPLDEDNLTNLITDYPAILFLNENPANTYRESRRGIGKLKTLLRRGLANLPMNKKTSKERQQEWVFRFVEYIDRVFYSHVGSHIYSGDIKGSNRINWLYNLCRLVDPTARDGLVDQIVDHLSTYS